MLDSANYLLEIDRNGSVIEESILFFMKLTEESISKEDLEKLFPIKVSIKKGEIRPRITDKNGRSPREWKVKLQNGEEKTIAAKDLIPNEFIANLHAFDFLKEHGEKISYDELKSDTLLEKFFPILLSEFSIYNLKPDLMKQISSAGISTYLEENGKNISSFLKKILASEEKSGKLKLFLKDALNFAEEIQVNEVTKSSIMFSLKEKSLKETTPNEFLSDGTVVSVAIILALFFDKDKIAVFEEPDNTLHPTLIAKFVDYFYDASSEKQIIITTHNPEVVRLTEEKDIILIKKKADGSSSISRPANNEAVQNFLRNDIDISELFTNNLISL